MHRFFPTAVAIVTCCFTSRALAAESLPIYQPKVKTADIYFHHPGAKPALKYNHDVDIVKFKGKFFAAWNANETSAEDVPGQYNFLSVSDDFEHWSAPVRLFTRDAAAENPVETDNQWQPIFINWRDETLFCAWCDYNARKTYIATSTDGVRLAQPRGTHCAAVARGPGRRVPDQPRPAHQPRRDDVPVQPADGRGEVHRRAYALRRCAAEQRWRQDLDVERAHRGACRGRSSAKNRPSSAANSSPSGNRCCSSKPTARSACSSATPPRRTTRSAPRNRTGCCSTPPAATTAARGPRPARSRWTRSARATTPSPASARATAC